MTKQEVLLLQLQWTTIQEITCSPLTSDVFIVTVNPQNDPPVTIGDELAVLEGGTVTVTTRRSVFSFRK